MLCFHVETIDLHLYRVVNQHPVYAGWCDDTLAVNLVLIAWSPAVVRLSYQRENLTYRYESREESNPYGCESIDEQGRACGEGVVKTPAPRTLRAMRNFAIKKAPRMARTMRGADAHTPSWVWAYDQKRVTASLLKGTHRTGRP